MNLTPTTKKQTIKNYAFNTIVPFSVAKAAADTEIKEKVVDNYLRSFSKSGVLTRTRIKGRYYYMFNRPTRPVRNKAGPVFWDFTPNREKLARIHEVTLSEDNTIAEISKRTGFSKRLVNRYVKILVVIKGCIKVIKGRKRLYRGSNVEMPEKILTFKQYLNKYNNTSCGVIFERTGGST